MSAATTLSAKPRSRRPSAELPASDSDRVLSEPPEPCSPALIDATRGDAIPLVPADVELENSVGGPGEQAVSTSDQDSTKSTKEQASSLSPARYPWLDLTPKNILEVLRDFKVTVFQDKHGTACVWLPNLDSDGLTSHYECLGLRTRQFLSKILDLITKATNKTPDRADLKTAIEELELKSYLHPKRELGLRRRELGGEVFIDLCDSSGEAVKISRDGCTTVTPKEPMFIRHPHMTALPKPIWGGDVNEIFEFVPVSSSEQGLLLLAWIIGALNPAIPNPILVLTGQQGSAKTTRTRRLRALLDPSVVPVLGDSETKNLFLTFQQHSIPCFENVGTFRRAEADMFCRAVTGNGIERRRLFTDNDQVLYSFRRSIIISGIDVPSTRPDFLDRCLIFPCDRMKEFKTQQELDRRFDEARPRLFGALLELMAKTMAIHPTVKATSKFRMADFASFGRAVAAALGMDPLAFDAAYSANAAFQHEEVLDGSPMYRAVRKFAGRHPVEKPWTGTSEQLLIELRTAAYESSDNDAKLDMPKNARWLSSRLTEMTSALASQGIVVEKLPRTNAQRGWKVYSVATSDPNSEPNLFEILEDLAKEPG